MPNVLYIEDDPISARLLQKHLKLDGYDVDIALDGDSGLEKFSSAPYDAVLVDYYMPGNNGLQVLKALQAMNTEAPCIMLTAMGDEKIAVQALQYGAFDYIVKDGERGFLDLLSMVIEQALTTERLKEEKTQAEIQEQDQRTFTETLIDITNALNSTLDLDKVLEYIVDNVKRVVPHDGSAVLFTDPLNTATFVHANGRYNKERVVGQSINIEQAENLHVMLNSKRSFIVNKFGEDLLVIGGEAWMRSCVGAPICHQDKVIGFLNLYADKPFAFTEQHAERLEAFATQAAVAITNAQMYQAIQSYSVELEHKVAQRTKHLVRAKERVEAILDSSPDAILLLHNDGTVSSHNPVFLDAFGYSSEEVFSTPLTNLITTEARARVADAMQTSLETGEVTRVEATAVTKDDVRIDVEVSFSALKRASGRGIVCTISDISDRKEVERMKDAFVSNVSHEMRTPITSLKLHHQLLRRATTQEKRLHHLEIAERETARLGNTIEDLLLLSRMEQEQVAFQMNYIDLANLIKQQVLDRQDIAAELDLQLEFSDCDLPEIKADAGLISQVCNVLLTNAMNYTPRGGSICVEMLNTSTEALRWAGFRVSDTGVGIKQGEIERIFERFYRGTTGRSRAVRGAGLGLSIASQVIEAHNGRIEVFSKGVGRGASFTVLLPAQ